MLPTKDQLDTARNVVSARMASTPEIRWPLLCGRTGAEVWGKHENHTPIGAFKIRGGLNFLTKLKDDQPDCLGVITATRGNHGQSVALAAAISGFPATILVPHGNNPEKNAAIHAFGAELIEHGEDFQEAYEHGGRLAAERGLREIPPYHPWLVEGVGTYSLEFLGAQPDLDTVYVPIGMGSGISGLIAAREGLGLKTKIVGVVAENAPCYALSFEAGKPVATNSSDTLADGVVQVSEDEILAAMCHYFTDTHNAAEGAGAAPLAALLKERGKMAGKKVGLILSGGNPDKNLFARALAEVR